MLITIDGPAASGKSSIAQALARYCGYQFLGTGLLYRAAGYLVYRHNPVARVLSSVDIAQLGALAYRYNAGNAQVMHNGQDILPAVQAYAQADLCASLVGVDAGVRAVLTALFRQFAHDHARVGVVAEGRDCGTVIFPQATHKFYLTALPRVRAQRMLADTSRQHATTQVDELEALLAARDERDSTRAVAPLRPADDAIIIDSSQYTFEETLAMVIKRIV